MAKACRICGNVENNAEHIAYEMMFGTRDRFEYLECSACGTLQLLNVPDLRAYYPRSYYSLEANDNFPVFRSFRSRLAAPRIAKYFLTGRGAVGGYLARTRPFIAGKFPLWLREFPGSLSLNSSILDFGSGNGGLLRLLSEFGFRKLTGADAFIENDLQYAGVRIFKCSLGEIEAKFDIVMLHHAFEHLPDPRESLRQLYRLTNENATVLIRIPIVSYAWEKYGVNWVQLDPPRHLFLYTEKAFRMLVEDCGFAVVKVVYDSEAFQFHGSEQYAMGIPMNDPQTFRGAGESAIFTQRQHDEWKRQAAELNAAGRGDQACFYLKKKVTS